MKGPPSAPVDAPSLGSTSTDGPRREWMFRVAFAAIALFVAGIAPATARWQASLKMPRNWTMGATPTVDAPWKAMAGDPYRWRPRNAQSAADFVQAYTNGRRVVKAFIAYYPSGGAHGRVPIGDGFLATSPWVAGRHREDLDGHRWTAVRRARSHSDVT